MTISTPPDNTVLILSPPIINGQTKPVEGGHTGVPLVAHDLIDGAIVHADPPLSGTMDPGDVMELWLEGELAALDSKTIEDPNVRTMLRIPKGRLQPDQVNKLYYTVRRGSDNRGTSTPSLEILYNRVRPGLKDRLTDPGGHSELKLLLPDVIKNGVGADFVSAEVCVAYPYCRAYDVITLTCNGELLEPKPRVSPNQAPPPPNPGDETPITICFTVTRAFLDKAKRQDNKLHFSYTVTDQIGNGPDTDAPWSPVQSVDEDLDGKRLDKPILLERREDYPGDDAETIDLEKLTGNPLLLDVPTQDNPMARYGSGEVSAARTFTETPVLEIDTTPMLLDGAHLYPPPPPTRPEYFQPIEKAAYIPPGAHQTRQARGGSPPFEYSSSKPTVASVDPATGHVISKGNGIAMISVRDTKGNTVSYQVTCENVYDLVVSDERRLPYDQAVALLSSLGAQLFTVDGTPLQKQIYQALLFGIQQPKGNVYIWATTFIQPNDYYLTYALQIPIHPTHPGWTQQKSIADYNAYPMGYKSRIG